MGSGDSEYTCDGVRDWGAREWYIIDLRKSGKGTTPDFQKRRGRGSIIKGERLVLSRGSKNKRRFLSKTHPKWHEKVTLWGGRY